MMRKILLAALLLCAPRIALGQVSGAGQLGCPAAPVSGTAWTSATALNATQIVAQGISASAALVQLNQTTTITAGAITFQITYDGTNWISVPLAQVLNASTGAQLTNPYTLVASTNQPFLIALGGATSLRLLLNVQILGSGSVTPFTTSLCATPTSPLSLNASGALKVDGSAVTQPISAASLPLPTGASTSANQPPQLADNGVAAATNRTGVLGGIYQTDYNNGVAGTQGRNAAQNQGTDGLTWVAALPAIRPASYHASAIVAPAATATDIATMPGNATNTVLVTGIRISCTQTTGSIINVSILMRTTADSAGTPVTTAIHEDDSTYLAASSAPKTWTANPTKGTLEAMVDSVKLGCMAPGTVSPNDIYISPANWRMKPQVLRGTAQELEVNLGTPIDGAGTTVTGGSFLITFEWMEIKTITP
jgi:hypothetical protein